MICADKGGKCLRLGFNIYIDADFPQMKRPMAELILSLPFVEQQAYCSVFLTTPSPH
jgi:hypothetical protein